MNDFSHSHHSGSHDKNKESTRILQRLRRNDPELTCLRISNKFHTVEAYKLLQALQTNHTVEQVDISGIYVATLSNSEKLQFWQAISQLPQLSVVWVRDFPPECPLSTHYLVNLLKECNAKNEYSIHTKTKDNNHRQSGIVELDFSNVILIGDIQELQLAMQEQKTLKQIQSWELHWIEDRTHINPMAVLEMLLS